MAVHELATIPHPDEAMADNKRTLADLLLSLDSAGASHVLIGGLVAGYYGKPRATVDVDMLIPKRTAAKVEAELVSRGYAVEKSTDMLRVCRQRSKAPVADLLFRESHPLLKAAYAHSIRAVILRHEVHVVTRGAFVALKFHAAISPQRDYGDKLQDVADIARVLSKGFAPEDEALAIRIAEKAYTGAGSELERLLDDLRHRRPVRI
jgi:hypothetical protein